MVVSLTIADFLDLFMSGRNDRSQGAHEFLQIILAGLGILFLELEFLTLVLV